jgi:sulfate transport system substrate-binding protein
MSHDKSKVKLVLGVVLVIVLFGVYWAFQTHQAHQAHQTSRTKTNVSLTNVSYDPTREFYGAYNKYFKKYWQKKTGQSVSLNVSNGGSGKQANSVIDGNQADVVTLALAQDVDAIQKAGLINKNWESAFPDNSAPYTSTIVFLVRKDNPKKIHDWNDLVKSGVKVISPNPKTSGAARWNFLAAWAYANKHKLDPKQFEKQLYQNVKVLDSGSRDATTTFVQNQQGDVLINWENEAKLAVKEHPGKYEIITPSISIKAQPSVAVVNAVAKKRGTTKLANAYIRQLYTTKAQKIAAENYYRPANKKVAKAYKSEFPSVKMVTINDKQFGGWAKVQKKYFSDGGIFDQIYTK